MKERLQIEYVDDEGMQVFVPAKYDVCHNCQGTGKQVNPSIDGHGISSEEFANDPDFEESYFRGDFDIPCLECKGERVVLVIDEILATPEQIKGYRAEVESIRQMEAEYEAERRMGA